MKKNIENRKLSKILKIIIIMEVIAIIVILLCLYDKKTIRFNGNGATGNMGAIIVNTWQKVVVEENKFEKEGYEFDGWKVYNEKDNTWKCEEGWYTQEEIDENNYIQIKYTTEKLNEHINEIKNKGNIIVFANWNKEEEKTEEVKDELEQNKNDMNLEKEENINKDNIIDSENKNTNQDENTNTSIGNNNNDDNDDNDNSDNENKNEEPIKIEPPKIEGIENNKIYNKDVIANIISEVNTESILKDSNGNEIKYNSGDVIKEEGEYILKVTDEAGNFATVEFKIDKTNPEISEVPSITNKTITPIITDFTEVTATLNEEEYVIGTEIKEEGKYILKVTDEAGNFATIEFEIDKTSPEVLKVTKTPEAITNGDVTITIEVSEAVITKATRWLVSEDGKTLSKTFTENTIGSVSFIDMAGNVGNKEYTVENIDKQPPVLRLNGASKIELEYSEKYVEQGVEVTDDSFEGTITVTDCIIYYKGNKVDSINTTIPGTYEITYTYADEAGNKSSNVYRTVIVKEKVIVSKIVIDVSKTILKIGDSVECKVIVTPADAYDKNIIWTSSNDEIVSVDENGKIVAINAGTATITASATDGSGVTGSVEITVIVDATGIKLNVDSLDLKEGDTSKIEVIIEPENATNKNVTFESSDTSVVTIDENGNVIAIEEGKATITIKSGDGNVTTTIPVTVSRILVSKIVIISSKDIKLKPGNTMNFTATVLPTNAKIKDIQWSSSDYSIATVDENGKVTAITGGTVTITASATDGSGVSVSIAITVIVDANEIKTNVDSLDLKEGDISKIEATIEPENATNKNVTFESLDTSVVTVDENGNVKAVEEGTTTIIMKSGDGNVTKTIPVTVSRILVSNITVNASKTILNPGQNAECSAIVQPANAKIKDVVWSSSDSSIATVDEKGTVTAITGGTARIIASATDGSGVIGSIDIKVVEVPEFESTVKIKATIEKGNYSDKWNTFKLILEIPSDIAQNTTKYIVRIASQDKEDKTSIIETSEKVVTDGKVEFTITQYTNGLVSCDYTIIIIAMNDGKNTSQISATQDICTGTGILKPIGFDGLLGTHSKTIKFE